MDDETRGKEHEDYYIGCGKVGYNLAEQLTREGHDITVIDAKEEKVFLTFVIISLDGFDFETNFTAIAATINNIGPGLAGVGPTQNFANYSVLSKLVLCFNMLAGRLEPFPMLLLFIPSTWKRK